MSKYKREWVLTDPSTNQYGRQFSPTLFEFKEDGREPEVIDITKGTYEVKEIEHCINAYGYTLMNGELKNPKLLNIFGICDTEDEANWLIAECLFEMNVAPISF